jgi:hypothetical protein
VLRAILPRLIMITVKDAVSVVVTIAAVVSAE